MQFQIELLRKLQRQIFGAPSSTPGVEEICFHRVFVKKLILLNFCLNKITYENKFSGANTR